MKPLRLAAIEIGKRDPGLVEITNIARGLGLKVSVFLVNSVDIPLRRKK